jgi:IclR family KDG regulon transcriptional repressor
MGTSIRAIHSVLKAAQILDSFTLQKSVYTNVELSNRLGINKTTIARLLYTLERSGFLNKDGKTKEYKLSHKLYRLGSVYISQIDLHIAAMPELSELAMFCHETVHLAILNDFNIFYLDKVESSRSIGMISRIGNLSPAYCTGVGKVLLAYLDKEKLKTFFRSVKLKRYTPNTICHSGKLATHLKKIRQQGYAFDDAEHEPDVRCVAAPVLDRNGNVVASISIAGPVYRMDRNKMETELLPAVKTTAEKISARLGYSRG